MLLCYIMLYYVILLYVMLCYIIHYYTTLETYACIKHLACKGIGWTMCDSAL